MTQNNCKLCIIVFTKIVSKKGHTFKNAPQFDKMTSTCRCFLKHNTSNTTHIIHLKHYSWTVIQDRQTQRQ